MRGEKVKGMVLSLVDYEAAVSQRSITHCLRVDVFGMHYEH